MNVMKWINTGAFAAMVAVNALANLIPLGGNTTGEVSKAYPNLFTPAPLTFAIWGVIYLLLAVFILYQWEIFDGGVHSAQLRQEIGPWFAVSCALNIAWIFCWHYRAIGLSTICIVTLLAVLMLIESRAEGAQGGFFLKAAARTGFSVYYGWIIAATIANVCVLLAKSGWKGWGLPADFWTAAILMAGAVIASAVAVIGNDRIAAGAVMWAYAGILMRHISPAYEGGRHPYVIAAAVFCEAVILAAVFLPQLEWLFARMRGLARR